jgi:hypothetical protein
MKQKELIQAVYKACCKHDDKKLSELRKTEFQKIFKHRNQGKPFTPKWAVINL